MTKYTEAEIEAACEIADVSYQDLMMELHRNRSAEFELSGMPQNHAAAAEVAEARESLFWYRPRSDGGYEGPLHHLQMCRARKESGSWVGLFTAAQVVAGARVARIDPATGRVTGKGPSA